MGVFYFVFCVLAFLMQLTAGAWLLKCFPQLGWKIPLTVMGGATALMFAGFTLTRTHQTGLWHALYYLAYIYFGFVFLAFVFCAGFAVLNKILTFFHLPTVWLGPVSLVTLCGVFVVSLWGGFQSPAVKKIPLHIPGAAPMKIALLSDTHLGMGVSVARFEQIIRKIQAEQPDVLFVLGDIFEYGPHREAYAALLQQIKPPLGTVGVLGNHEYYVGYAASKDFYRQAGITLLENEALTLSNGVQVAGLKDIKTAGVTSQDVAAVLQPLTKTQPVVLLSHTPLLVETAARHGVHLMLSGHTHNGQLWPFVYLVKTQFKYIYGLHQIGSMQLYVTSGVFYWGIPLRFLAPSEIAVLEVNP